jgi:hypothetical protein
VNDAANCIRTINGELFIAWASFPSEDRIAAYRIAGAKCRRFGVELFVREKDRAIAAHVDWLADKEAN